jgi:hypothetical protein
VCTLLEDELEMAVFGMCLCFFLVFIQADESEGKKVAVAALLLEQINISL